MAAPKVLLVGHITHDRRYGGLDRGHGLVPGGGVFYAGEVYRRLGAELHISAVVGEDFAFDDVPAAASRVVTRRGRTTTFTNLYPPGQPRIQLIEGVAPRVTPDALPPALRRADIVHLAPVIGEVDIAAWKAAVDTPLLAISVQGWVRAAGAPVDPAVLAGLVPRDALAKLQGPRAPRHVMEAPWAIDGEVLAGVDVACLSHEDLAGQGDLLDRLCDAVPLVALTHGGQGCELIERGRRTRVGVYDTRELEPTGAGDTFAAAFLYQRAMGASTTQAARFGAAAASIVIEGEGGAALERLHEANERAHRVPLA